jgi:spermidine synthase
MTVALYILFVLSGAAGLFYESTWARYLGLFVGHDAYAQVIVLVIFLGGMSLGAILAGRYSERLKEPLLGYAVVEGAVGVIGLFFHEIFGAATSWAYSSLFPPLAGSVGLTIAKWGLASLLILPQSILLGATFPLMSAGVLRRVRGQPGRVLAILYFANSFGAAVGVLVAGFYLLRLVGLPGTVVSAAMLNLVVALGAILVIVRERRVGVTVAPGAAAAPSAAPGEPAAPGSPLALPRLTRVLLAVSFGTAVASFIYEIDWIRMLSLVLGSATHSFELMLSAFILGLALGSFWLRTRADRFTNPVRTLGVVQWVMGLLALATLPLYVESFDWTATMLSTFAKTDGGYTAFTLARYAICLIIMLPATFCAGITLPLITRTLLAAGSGERVIGTVYGVNTLGSIVGVVLAGLILLPLIGLKAMLIAGGTLDMGIGLWLLFLAAPPGPAAARARRHAQYFLRATIAVLIVGVLSRNLDPIRLTSGVYRYGSIPDASSRQTVFYRDGRTATVAVFRGTPSGYMWISTNGKPDASLSPRWMQGCDSVKRREPLRDDEATQALLALVTLAHGSTARSGAVIGMGSGMSSHLLLGSPRLEKLTTIEIEPTMVAGARAFQPANRRVYDDPRSSIVIDDAKAYFAAANQRYDLIFSEPSNPWVSGVSSLFTDEFYQQVARYLSDGGVFGQWMHIYEMNDDLLLTVLGALHRNFAAYEIFMVDGTDILVVASNRPVLPRPDWGVFQLPAIATDLCHAVIPSAAVLEGARLIDRAALAPLLEDGGWLAAPNSDFYPRLDLGTERTRYLATVAAGFRALSVDRFNISAALSQRRIVPIDDTVMSLPGIPRGRALVLGAILRALTRGSLAPGADTARLQPDVAEALYRRQLWDASMRSGGRPFDWRIWLAEFNDVERDANGGTAGAVDEALYRDVFRFLDRTSPPLAVRSAVAFRYSLATWNFARAVFVAPPLVGATVDGAPWIPPDELRDGLVVAHLLLRDPDAARRSFEGLKRYSARQPRDLRTLLLASYVIAAER